MNQDDNDAALANQQEPELKLIKKAIREGRLEPVYEYQILYKLKEYEAWTMSSFHYKTIEEFEGDLNQFEGDLNQYESIEIFLPSKRLVQND